METWGSGGMAPQLLTSTLDEVRGRLHVPAILPPEKEALVAF
jgi:hypothetical protein